MNGGNNVNLLFLDIDGVLNAHEPLCPEVLCGRIHADKVGRLNRVLRSTDARIVLSSAWRYIIHRAEMNLGGMEWLLRSHGIIAGRLIGITRPDTMMPTTFDGRPENWPVENERGRQIHDWLIDNRNDADFGSPYVVVDDLDLGISVAGHPFVHVNGAIGLTDHDADRMIRMLRTAENHDRPGAK